ncbi:MAG: thiamine pyrophosphate-binding protein [Pirellulaceae bacterium]|nr:thiamine pyrophosphate-binding protein [Pirellulaceae bacterium]
MATADKTTNTEIMTGASIIVEALIRNGTQVVFAYPGGCSMPLHQALLAKKDVLRTILPRHEQGGGFAAQGVARTTGRAGVCIAKNID